MAREDRNDFEDTSTVKATIDAGASSTILSYYNTSILDKIEDIEYSSHNIIYDYIDELEEMCYTVALTDLEYIKYEFRPDLLSHSIYGTSDFDFVILALNGMLSPKEFTKKKIKMLSSDAMTDVINRIYNAEHSYLIKNRYT